MAKYRKKPVVIEAFQITLENRYNYSEWPTWLSKALENGILWTRVNGDTEEFMIKTLEGDMIISYLDYIIKGVENELYPCKPYIFELTYERI